MYTSFAADSKPSARAAEAAAKRATAPSSIRQPIVAIDDLNAASADSGAGRTSTVRLDFRLRRTARVSSIARTPSSSVGAAGVPSVSRSAA